ncbi:MAG TPA: DUF2971 domain-containing protein [Terrimicrobiaceae bacterium]
MIVYRYFNEQFGLMALQQTQWKIGRLLELNDPLDCQPTLLGQGHTEPLLAKDSRFIRDTHEWLGILCYSAQIDDPVIWSHYAECHRGIALGFELPPIELFKVEYRADDARAQLDYDKFEQLVRLEPGHALTKLIAEGFTRKASGWKYEEEYRQFIFLRECEMIGPHYFRGMPLPHLRRIVLGVNSRITDADIFRIRSQWKRAKIEDPHEPWHFEVAKAKIDNLSYNSRLKHN